MADRTHSIIMEHLARAYSVCHYAGVDEGSLRETDVEATILAAIILLQHRGTQIGTEDYSLYGRKNDKRMRPTRPLPASMFS
jgi:hypothetical protein